MTFNIAVGEYDVAERLCVWGLGGGGGGGGGGGLLWSTNAVDNLDSNAPVCELPLELQTAWWPTPS